MKPSRKVIKALERKDEQWREGSASAASQSAKGEPSAQPAMRGSTARRRRAGLPPEPPTPAGSEANSDASGSESTEPAPTSTSTPMSTTSDEPSKTSNRHWQKPRNVREFAAQANLVATMILNGEIDLDTARSYASLARVVAQSASVEVTRSRFLKTEPDLNLE